MPRKINPHKKYRRIDWCVRQFLQSFIVYQKLSCFIALEYVSKYTIFKLCSWFC
jgi:hypothetical protein